MNTRQLTITTDAAGAFAADIQTPGRIFAVSLAIGTLSTPDLTCTDLTTGAAVLSKAGISATTRFQPKVKAHDVTGTSIVAAAGPPVLNDTYTEPVVLSRMHVVVAGGGDTLTGTLYVTYG